MANQRRSLFDLLLPALFLGAIALVLASTDWRGRSNWVAELEMRPAAVFPAPPKDWPAAETWLDRLGTFFTDHFGLRQAMVDWQGRLLIGLLHRSPSPQVIVGRDGFLFYNGQRSMEDYRHLDVFTPAELDHWAAELKARRDWLAARGIGYLFVVGPNKNTVYPEDVPDTEHRIPGKTRVEQLAARLGDVPYFFDLTATLRSQRDKGLLFFRGDTHWNDLGAFLAYRAIMGRVGLPVPPQVGSEPAQIDPSYVPDLWRIAGVTRSEPKTLRTSLCAQPHPTATDPVIYGPGDPAYAFPATECPSAKGDLLMFHDSFTWPMEPYISDSFRRVVYVRRMPTLGELQKAVEIEKPTLVIEERVERLLMMPIGD